VGVLTHAVTCGHFRPMMISSAKGLRQWSRLPCVRLGESTPWRQRQRLRPAGPWRQRRWPAPFREQAGLDFHLGRAVDRPRRMSAAPIAASAGWTPRRTSPDCRTWSPAQTCAKSGASGESDLPIGRRRHRPPAAGRCCRYPKDLHRGILPNTKRGPPVRSTAIPPGRTGRHAKRPRRRSRRPGLDDTPGRPPQSQVGSRLQDAGTSPGCSGTAVNR